MEKKLVSRFYNKPYDECQKVHHDFSSTTVVYDGKKYRDVTKALLESQTYELTHMSPEQIKEQDGLMFRA